MLLPPSSRLLSQQGARRVGARARATGTAHADDRHSAHPTRRAATGTVHRHRVGLRDVDLAHDSGELLHILDPLGRSGEAGQSLRHVGSIRACLDLFQAARYACSQCSVIPQG